MVVTCCYCFKRKYTDVLPPYTPFSSAEYEKFRFGVVGQDRAIHVEVKAKPFAPSAASGSGTGTQGDGGNGEDKGAAVGAGGAAVGAPAIDMKAAAGTGL